MNKKEPIRLDVVGENGEGLAIEFLWSQDRFSHRLYRLAPDDERMLLVSQEGQPKDGWPSSPPIQQLRRHASTADREVILGLGMAGNSHWSLSVESMNSPPTLLFDVACRVRGAFQWLGSTYEFSPDGDQPEFEPRAVLGLPGIRVGCQGGDAQNQVNIVGNDETPAFSIKVEPGVAGNAQRTLRWQYHVEITSFPHAAH